MSYVFDVSVTAPSHISQHLEPIQTNALSTSFEVQYKKLRLRKFYTCLPALSDIY
jgi:hypothetical protein